MGEWGQSDLFKAVAGAFAGASLVAILFLVNRRQLRHLRLLWRPSGTRASFAARAALGLGLVAGVVGFLSAVQEGPPRWATPLLWSGFGVAMAAGLAVGFTARTEASSARDQEQAGHRDRRTRR